ncbi:MAG: transposase family protein [Chloroflexi bacterium]|nr:transposase family protein [Chloroflexota bacterium]
MDCDIENEQKYAHKPIPNAPVRAKRKFCPPPPANCDAFAPFRNVPSPPRYVRPKHDYIKPRKLPWAMRKSTMKQYTPIKRHKRMTIRPSDGLSNVDLKEKLHRDTRKRLIAENRTENRQIFEDKPTEHVWNANNLLPRFEIPIADYGEVLCSDTHYSRTLIRLKQREDPHIWGVIHYLKTGNNLIPNDFPKYLRRFMMAGRYAMDENDILVWKHGNGKQQLRVIPPALRQSLIDHLHTGHSSLRHTQAFHFHHGSQRILSVLKNTLRYWWPKVEQHIKTHCRCCNTCQHIKPGIYRKWRRGGQMKLFVATRPFEQISVDIVGPLPTSHSHNRYIVSMIDSFSRYCMLVPVKSVTAMDIVHAIDRWITTFGPPKSILSDNGPQFISAIYRDYNENCRHGHRGIIRKYTSTYYPQCNGQIERLHRWIKERLCLIAYDNAKNFVDGTDDWSDYLGLIQYTYNCTPNSMTTYAPMRIVLGHDPYHFPRYTFDPSMPEQYMRYMAHRQAIILKDANTQQRVYDEYRKKHIDKSRDQSLHYRLHQRVLYNINSHFVGNAHKLGPKWVGPYEITQIFNDGQSYELTVIPMLGSNESNPMNLHITPRRATHEYNALDPAKVVVEDRNGSGIILAQTFIVPRSQIKPYFDRYEARFTGEQSPAEVALNVMRSEFHRLQKSHELAMDYEDKYGTDPLDIHVLYASVRNGAFYNDCSTNKVATSQLQRELKEATNAPMYCDPKYGYNKFYPFPPTKRCEHAIQCMNPRCGQQTLQIMQRQSLILSAAHSSFQS